MALGFGLPVYVALLPHAPALGALILGGFVIGLPWSFRRALSVARSGFDGRQGDTVP